MIKPRAHLVAPFLLAPGIGFARPASFAPDPNRHTRPGRGFLIDAKGGGRVY